MKKLKDIKIEKKAKEKIKKSLMEWIKAIDNKKCVHIGQYTGTPYTFQVGDFYMAENSFTVIKQWIEAYIN